jgi:hypothetical protein
MSCLLLRMGHSKTGTLRLRVGTLHWELETLILKLWMMDLHRYTTRKWGSNKLTRLRKVWPNVAFGMLAWENHLALAVLFHLFQLILDDDHLVKQILEI